ncbi:MAG: ethylbenzene dehydrogenase-related protein [Planctomycetota bacterium]|nr:ethylbenzene dehydrogenase-related protein [Planctomycetota bacterium]MDP6503463.1 ethylbenzene dehydrogenase-related protein [Planctomycetota bacterium]
MSSHENPRHSSIEKAIELMEQNRSHIFCPGLAFALSLIFITSAEAQEHHWRNIGWLDVPVDSSAKPPENDENREAGRKIYFKKCYFCHGDKGDGLGAAEVQRMDPRPRDFTKGKFKFKTVIGDEPPTDEDLYRTLTRGVVGTAMPYWAFTGQTGNWENYRYLLSPEERWQVIYFFKTYSVRFKPGLEIKIAEAKAALEKGGLESKVEKKVKKDLKRLERWLKKYDEDRQKFPPLEIGNGPPITPELIAEGKKLFEEVGECLKCHGAEGRGDKMERKDDDWGFPITAVNLTRAINFKGGNGVREIFRTITTGINGTPMPTTAGMFFKEDPAADEAARWAIAAYVNHLSTTTHPKVKASKTVLTADRLEGDLPTTPDDPAWEAADVIDVAVSGQVMVEPKQWWPTVNYITVRALYNAEKVAFKLSWDDRTKSLGKPPKTEDGKEPKEVFPDGVHIQLPSKIPDGPVKPHFFLGTPGNKVNLWHYHADKDGDARSPVEERTASGSSRPPKAHPPESQQVGGKGAYADGQWEVVMIRDLTTEDKDNDIQFARGKLIPLSFSVWDGDNGDQSFKTCVSTWYYLILKTKTPAAVYLWTVIALVLAVGVEFWLVKKAGNT